MGETGKVAERIPTRQAYVQPLNHRPWEGEGSYGTHGEGSLTHQPVQSPCTQACLNPPPPPPDPVLSCLCPWGKIKSLSHMGIMLPVEKFKTK